MEKRVVDVVVLSDVHLGTYACRAKELLIYLRSISPRLLILNGDIIDGWQFSKHYFPADHIQVIQEILNFLSTGTRVIYITGNHDEALRKYARMQLGNLQLADKALIEINGSMTWIFHGDVFDHASKNPARIVSRLGSNGYAVLLGFNKLINRVSQWFGREKISFAKSVMTQFNKRFVKIENFEKLVGELAIDKKYDCVICGHIHEPKKRTITNEKGSVVYLNSGDWVEHMTTLEYHSNDWHLYTFDQVVEKATRVKKEKPETQVIPVGIDIYLDTRTG
ncbi:MAG: UDP-2,3-diacylglucosamine diphosphatase [Chitinophagaceae bacterium]